MTERCPFNPSHILPADSLLTHFRKCKATNKHLFSQCKFNLRHMIRTEFIEEHMRTCPDNPKRGEEFSDSDEDWDRIPHHVKKELIHQLKKKTEEQELEQRVENPVRRRHYNGILQVKELESDRIKREREQCKKVKNKKEEKTDNSDERTSKNNREKIDNSIKKKKDEKKCEQIKKIVQKEENCSVEKKQSAKIHEIGGVKYIKKWVRKQKVQEKEDYTNLNDQDGKKKRRTKQKVDKSNDLIRQLKIEKRKKKRELGDAYHYLIDYMPTVIEDWE